MATRTVKQGGGAQYTTIQAAASAATDGDTILIQDSATYTGKLDLTSNGGGGWVKLVNIHADTGCTPTWSGVGNDGSTAPCINIAAAKPGNITGGLMTVKGIRFTGWNFNAGYGSGVIMIGSYHIVQLERCTFDTCGGVTLNYARGDAGTHCILDRCTWRNTATPLFANSANKYIDFVNCDIYTNANNHGIDAYYSTCTVSFCTVVTRNGIFFSGVQAGTVRNTVVRNLTGYGADKGIRVVTDVDYSCVYGGFATPFSGTQGAHNLTSDPQFISEGALDFHLLATSPLVNAGVDVGITLDRDSNTRPAGAGYDIGAYERIAAVTGASCTSSTTVRVTFSAAVAVTGALTSPSNYTLAQQAPANGVLPTISTVTPQGGGAPTYVDLTTTEHTNGQGYSVTLGSIPGVAGTANYTGVGVAPTVTGVTVRGPDTLRVAFSEPMTVDTALTSASQYGFLQSGPVVASVAPGTAPVTYVDLTLAGGQRNQHYTLRCKAGMHDLALNPTAAAADFDVLLTSSPELLEVLEAMTGVLGQKFGELYGTRATRLLSPLTYGDSTAHVESTLGWEVSGAISLAAFAGVVTYTGKTTTTLTGLAWPDTSGTPIFPLGSPVEDASRRFSAVDRARADMLPATASGEWLDIVARAYGEGKPWPMSDATFRGLLLVLIYLDRGTWLAVQRVLEAALADFRTVVTGTTAAASPQRFTAASGTPFSPWHVHRYALVAGTRRRIVAVDPSGTWVDLAAGGGPWWVGTSFDDASGVVLQLLPHAQEVDPDVYPGRVIVHAFLPPTFTSAPPTYLQPAGAAPTPGGVPKGGQLLPDSATSGTGGQALYLGGGAGHLVENLLIDVVAAGVLPVVKLEQP